MILSSRTPGPLSLATSEPWKPSVFCPPPRFVKSPPPKTALVASARPWYPEADGSATSEREREPRLVPPPALGGSSPRPPMPSPQPPSIDSLYMLSGCSCSSFSPLSEKVKTRSHSFTKEATEACVYPHDMFLSIRRDAAHTPHGVLIWAVRKYLEVPSMRVPLHLQLSMHEAVSPDDGVTRGAIGSGLKLRMRAKPIRMTHHKVMSILSRITPQKYDALREELMMLPLRQANDEELKEICKVVFEKAVQEPEYSALYARLAQDIGLMDGERERKERTLARRFFRQIIESCEEQFQRPLQLTADDMVDRTTGEVLCVEEAEMKRDRLKHRLVGNIRFVAELFNIGVVTEGVIEDIVRVLVGDYDPADPLSKEEYVFEVFVTLIRHTGVLLQKVLPLLLARALAAAKTIEHSHPKPRVRFLMMDLDDLNRKMEWVPEATVQRYTQMAPKAPSPQQTPKQPERGTPLTPSKSKNEGKRQSQKQTLQEYQNHNQRRNQQQEQEKEVNSLGDEESVGNFVTQKCKSLSNISPLQNSANTGITASPNTSSRSISLSSTSATAQTTCNANKSSRSIRKDNTIINHNEADDTNDNTNNLSHTSSNVRHRSQHEPYSSLVLTYVTDLNMSTSSNHLHQMNSPATSARAFSDCGGIHSSRPRHGSEFGGSSCQTSEGLRSPWAAAQSCTAPLTETVNMRDVTRQLMALFRTGGGEADAVPLRLRDMGLRNAIVCLTWWLRLAATHTSLFEDRSRIAALFSALLRTGACDASSLYTTVLEWLHFDMEKGEYDNCPRMFDNVAQMILQCHHSSNDTLPHIEVVRGMLNCGLMNVVLRDLSTNGGIDKMVTAVKGFHPVCAQVLQSLREPEDERLILRVAAQNRLRLLPYLMSASAGALDPLAQCLVFPRVSDDAELRLLRSARELHGGAEAVAARWREDAVCAALAPAAAGSTVGQLVAVMRVVGALLAAAHVGGHVAPSAVDAVVAGIVAQQQGILFQGAVVVELIAFHTQSFRGSAEVAPALRREKVKETFGHWRAEGIINGTAALQLLETLNESNDENCVYEIFHDHLTDVSWRDILNDLRGVL